MQWLIDIIYGLCKNYIDAYFASHPPACCWVNRGDPMYPDWQAADLTGDNTWRDLDLSSMVPVGTKSILLRITMEASSSVRTLSFRKKNNINWPNVAYCVLYAANRAHTYDKTVAVSSNRKIQYKLSSQVWITLQITLAAWHIGSFGAAGFVNRGDPPAPDFYETDFTKDSSWHSLDLSAIIPPSTKLVLMCCRVLSGSSVRSIRFRTHGNSNAANISHCENNLANMFWYYDIQVPTNGLQQIDYWSNLTTNPSITLTVKGWCL